jgi:S-formylglutathione hydrolase FrmB
MLVTLKHGSQALEMGKHVNVLIPEKKAPKGGFPVLYLLHGYYGDYTDWLYLSNVIRYVEGLDLVVVMPDGANSYYANHPKGLKYHDYISNDLIKLIEETFQVSNEREKRYIAGLSMGGFGALSIGLSHPELFSKVIALSAVIDIKKRKASFNEGSWVYQFETLFGNLEDARLDLYALSKNIKDQELLVVCGTEDFLYEDNKSFHEYLLKENVSHTYVEESGVHNWDFWDKHIKTTLDFITM